ncbi:MAG: Uracil-DNA glycosylase [Candidatus Moranbacteria bacterium GW2011_GWD2_36_12]|nr:MAG: Uracil-DNA glycosylase [Candidatus Moranbacteria bacterium GW2011_GWD2_36_12]KKQ04575.1 MAG: Uracil-DNA glycosylase [Candidatus Moranbacteria bacterium GW2011_GWE2_36_40]
MTKSEKLIKLNNKILRCSQCALCANRGHVVFGAGNPDAKIIFIGEAPGKKEDELGVPFVGSSGRILDKMLASIKIKREDVYLTNICKCRPPENRDPLPEEVKECWPWLKKQIEIIQPKIIVTLGKYALNSFVPDTKISEVHGKILKIKIPKLGELKIFPLHHPAAARINKKTRTLFEEDFAKIPTLLKNKKEQ